MKIILVTRDRSLREAVLASAAALGREVEVVRDDEMVRRSWREAGGILIGADAAETVAALRLPPRAGVHLVGPSAPELLAWSPALGASVIVLPDSSGALAGVLSVDHAAPAVWVLGASGGVGASCLAGAIAVQAARGRNVALVEMDAFGGGIDLLFGAEAETGWRWSDLAGAVGQLGDLSGLVPRSAGVDLVSMARSEAPRPTHSAHAAVFSSLARTHEAVIVDGGTSRPPVPDLRVILLVAADVRSVAAARAKVSELALADAEIVVRTGLGRGIEPHLVADALGGPLLSALPTDRRLPRMLEAGRPPGTIGGRYARAVRKVCRAVLP